MTSGESKQSRTNQDVKQPKSAQTEQQAFENETPFSVPATNAKFDPRALTPARILQLQRMIGNQATSRLVAQRPQISTQPPAQQLVQRVKFTVNGKDYDYGKTPSDDWIDMDAPNNLSDAVSSLKVFKTLQVENFDLAMKVLTVINDLDQHITTDRTFGSPDDVYDAVLLLAKGALSQEIKQQPLLPMEAIQPKAPQEITFEKKEQVEKKTTIDQIVQAILKDLEKGGYAVSGGLALSLWEKEVLKSKKRVPNDVDLIVNQKVKEKLKSGRNTTASEGKLSVAEPGWDRDVDLLDEGPKYGTIGGNTTPIQGLDVLNLNELLIRKKKQIETVFEELDDDAITIKFYRDDILKILSDIMLINSIMLVMTGKGLNEGAMNMAQDVSFLLNQTSIMSDMVVPAVSMPLQKINGLI